MPDPVAAPTHRDARGALTVLAAGLDLPFAFDRCFYVHGAPVGAMRGGHAHRAQHQAIFCPTGRLSVLVADAAGERTVILDRPDQLLHLPPLTWAEETPVAEGTVWVVLASGRYDPADYLKTRDAWRKAMA